MSEPPPEPREGNADHGICAGYVIALVLLLLLVAGCQQADTSGTSAFSLQKVGDAVSGPLADPLGRTGGATAAHAASSADAQPRARLPGAA